MKHCPPVLIVGAGPAGLVLALALARRGVSVDVYEAAHGIAPGSRALGLSRRSLQILDSHSDVGGRCVELGLPWVRGRTFYRDTEVFRLELPPDVDNAYPAMLNLSQHQVMRLLLDEIDATAGQLVRVRWSSAITAVRDQGTHVVADVTGPGGRASTIAAGWLVGCDGAHSTVRDQLGAQLQGESWDTRFVIVDVRFVSDYPAERRAWFDPPSNPGSTVLMHRQPDDVWRLDFQVPTAGPADPAAEIDRVIHKVRQHLRHIGEHGDVEIIWSSSYRARALTAPSYRYGRVLLAGDAAHLIPIFGIRGMNSAIEDVNNLAWKLAEVVQGRAGVDVLDTYSTERLAAARENIRLSTRSTLFMAPPTPAHTLIRDAVLGLVADGHHGWSPVIDPRQTSIVAHHDSPLHTSSEPELPGPAPGDIYLDSLVTTADDRAVYLSSLIGRDAVLLCFGEIACLPAPSLCRSLRILLVSPRPGSQEVPTGVTVLGDPSGAAYQAWAARPGDAFLIRPDGHVAAHWQHPTETRIQGAIARMWGVPA